MLIFSMSVACSYLYLVYLVSEAATRGVLCKKVFYEISQNSQENTLRPATLLKKKLQHRCFPVNFAKFCEVSLVLQNTYLKEHLLVVASKYSLSDMKNNTQEFKLCSMSKHSPYGKDIVYGPNGKGIIAPNGTSLHALQSQWKRQF